MIVMAIDPGLSGAIAVFIDDVLIDVVDMPTHELTRNGKAKRQVAAADLAGIFTQHDPRHVIVEKVSAMPGQGVTSCSASGAAWA